MLLKLNRADKKTLEIVFKNGKSASSPNLNLRFLETKDGFPPRISFVSPKSISKKAVIRNLLRRRGYSALAKNVHLFPDGFVGAFVLGKKSKDIFGGRITKTKNGTKLVEEEIQAIINKIYR